MTRTRVLIALGFAALAVSIAWVLFIGLPRWTAKPTPQPEEPRTATVAEPEPATSPSAPHIKARLYYLSDDGLRLRPEEREVLLGTGTAEQARHIVEAQLEPVQAPMASAIPEGTKLKELFISDKGEAYVDLSSEVSTNHPGGSLDEILTVYTVVDALTDNLPAITSVQILIDGKEVDTLAGHVDLRRPLAKNMTWVEAPAVASPSAPSAH
jgi:spore germination protein GerM